MWRLAAALLVASLAAGGCGKSAGDSETARYLDPRSDAVLAVDLDYAGGNWTQVKRLYERGVASSEGNDRFSPRTLDALLADWTAAAGLSFTEDVRPLLGGTLQIGVRVEPAPPLSPATRELLERLDFDATRVTADEVRYYAHDGSRLDTEAVNAAIDEQGRSQPSIVTTAAYTVEDPGALARVLEKLKGVKARPIPGVEGARRLADGVAVTGDDTIVAVMREDGGGGDRLLRERLSAAGDGPVLPELGDDFIAARASPTLLGAWLDRDELARALGTAAGRALRGAEASVRLEGDAARADARVDFDGLADDELPLPEAGPLSLPTGEGVASASADQSRTTVFLARLARELYPDSRFVRRVEALERDLGLRFEDEVLRQFAGPSFSVLRPEGPRGTEFGARSTLRDPAAMRELLPRLAPALPGILEALEGLGSTGLASLLFVAPDAPLTPAAFGILASVQVSRLAGAANEQLYEVRGLDARAGPDSVVYGIVGDAFVVASTAELAREVAALQTEAAPEAATRLRVDVGRLLDQAEAEFGSDEEERLLRALLERVEASASARDGDVVGEAELRWAR